MTATARDYSLAELCIVAAAETWRHDGELLDARMDQHYSFPGVKLKPSEYFIRQMGASFMYEPTGLEACYKAFGADCLYWSTDFPHPATCWPNSQAQVKSQFAEANIQGADRQKIICDNGLKLFGL